MSAAGSLRAVAAETVDAVVSHGQSLDRAIERNEARVPEGDRALLRMLGYGCLRHHWQLQEWIDNLLARPLRRRDRVINSLLALGLYQLAHTRIPDHAVVSETVAAARRLKRPKLAGLVNACLRRFVREDLASREPGSEVARWNHPQWLIDRLQKDWPEDWQGILEENQARAPMWLRVNRSRCALEDYRRQLEEDGAVAESLPPVPDALRLSEPRAVDALPGFRSGDVSVQDAAAQLAAVWLMKKTPGRVLDACAAPGGKSGHLLEIGGADLSLLSIDSDADRSQGIGENLARLQLDATIITADASKPKEWWDGQVFDAILLDAPCSASGVIRRHPDIKLLRRESDLERLAQIQRELLRSLWPLLAPGGTLLYATCSVLGMENDEVTEDFLARQDDAIESDVLPNNNIRDLMRRKACGYQILPGTAGMDGFYYAAFDKKKVS